MDINKSVKQYLDEISSNSPTPGGGNVSAFCGALAACLGQMVCELTIGKKKYADVEQEMSEYKNKLITAREKFLELARKDNEAFDKVMSAFKLPKETDEEKQTRNREIQNATKKAAEVPLSVMEEINNLYEILANVFQKGNKNSASDAGVAAILANAACQGAFLNVIINAKGLENRSEANQLIEKSTNLSLASQKKSSEIFELIKKEILVA